MKFTTAFAVLVALATAVSGAPLTNAKRLANGLAPNPPVRRDGSHVYGMWNILSKISFFFSFVVRKMLVDHILPRFSRPSFKELR
jgi:hypothetical protein